MSESWHDYGFGICTSNLKEEISLPGLMELISQAPELKERVNTFINNECGGAFKDSYDILTSYVEQYGMSDAVRSLQEYIKKDAETDYDLESYAADGIGTENIDDLMKIFLSDRKRQRITITDSGEWKNYSADFNASYGWESVLVKMFKILGVYLANGSQLDISIDNDYNGLVIRNGICKQINLKGEEEKSL